MKSVKQLQIVRRHLKELARERYYAQQHALNNRRDPEPKPSKKLTKLAERFNKAQQEIADAAKAEGLVPNGYTAPIVRWVYAGGSPSSQALHKLSQDYHELCRKVDSTFATLEFKAIVEDVSGDLKTIVKDLSDAIQKL